MDSLTLALEFAKQICDELTADQLDTVNALNASSCNVCHTHDYCDANQVMIDAMEAVSGAPVEIDANDDIQLTLINDAWTIARRNEFNVDTISNTDKR